METTEFDATLGGSEHLPLSANNLKFAAARSIEIAALTELILRPSMTKLIFQTLPVHMRRRAMSHNCKRLPRKLRTAYFEQMMKSGLPPKQKRPSRKYRRRPKYLLKEYIRRQKRNIWLETHIWHAKRFHMTDRWGYRLAFAPCDKAFRACYRASSAHCLMQDISYVTPIRIEGPISTIKDMFKSITDSSCNLGVCAKAYISGNREGTLHLYEANAYPFDYIGKVHFIWVPMNNDIHTLWLLVHPAILKQVESLLTNLLGSSNQCDDTGSTVKRRKVVNNYGENVDFKILSGVFNIFRMTGPNSHAILAKSLKCIDDNSKIKCDEWVSKCDVNKLMLKEKNEYWSSLSSVSSPSQLSPHAVIGLVVRDPRLMRPTFRTKARCNSFSPISHQLLSTIPTHAPISPLWNMEIQEIVKKNVVTNSNYIDHITKTQLVPGEINENDPFLQSLPVVLVHKPGSQDSTYKKIGYGSGWDIIVPAGYGLPFWLTFIMFGARPGGLREMESLAFESGECFLPPDSESGKQEEKRIEEELKFKYFRLPPSKRVNYIKLGIYSPFKCQWNILIQDWSEKPVDNFFVLRDRQILNNLQDCLHAKKCAPHVQNGDLCLIPVYVLLELKGSLKRCAVICLPEPSDKKNIKHLNEPPHEDPNENLRKIKRTEHLKHIKQLRRKQIKLRKKQMAPSKKSAKHQSKEPSQYVKEMRELWLPSDLKTVRGENCRQVMGYISQGAFSFSEARSCGVGYVTYNALSCLLNMKINQVLVRNTCSRKYRLANLQIIKHR